MEPPDDGFQAFLADYLSRIEREGSAAIDALRQRHPEFAQRLGQQLEALVEHVGHRKEGLPARIGPNRIIRAFEGGGMGDVFLAEQTTPFRRAVVVKVVKVGKESAARLARFAVEIQTLASLNHNGIAKVYEAGSDHGRPFFTMEYVPGKAVTAYCAEERLGVNERLRLFVDICRAVEYAHRQGILHRDLKPSNILAYGPRSEPVVKIIDFGLAKVIRPEPDRDRRLTETAQIVGTPEYMSPEQVDVSRQDHVDTRTDVYGLGVVLYELLTGVLPLPIDRHRIVDVGEIVRMIRERKPSSPSLRVEEPSSQSDLSPSSCTAITRRQLSRQLAGDLDHIVMRALAKDPDDRYGSATQFAEDVQRYLRHEPISATSHTRSYLLRRFVRRHRAGTAFAATLVAVAVTSLVTIYLYALENIRNLERGNLFGLSRYVDELRAKELEPPPPRMESQPDRRQWLEQIELVLAQRGRMTAFLDSSPAGETTQTRPAGWANGTYADAVLRESLRDTLVMLHKMTQPSSEIDEVRGRCDWAERVRTLTVEARAREWEEVQQSLRSDPDFAGFDLLPQTGLVPIGPDPVSHRQEFALLLPGGTLPVRTDGKIAMDDRTCPVFVLLPGGENILVGSQRDDEHQERFDPEHMPGELVLATVEIRPFFASKYEFTNGQWALLDAGRHHGDPGSPLYAPRHPLIDANEDTIRHVVSAWGMRLPDEYEWEYLARGGTDSPRWCGVTANSLKGNENLYDQSLVGDENARQEGEAVSWHDGYPNSAPVGSLMPNGFGLYDVLGNAAELAEHVDLDGSVHLELRGGSWRVGTKTARATFRTRWNGTPLHGVGFRPVISVQT
ncbi:MAG: bifunctional serine/threonine-protein kinase/formylglycine-generating enzyme family protein [Planctomycetota bacterium]